MRAQKTKQATALTLGQLCIRPKPRMPLTMPSKPKDAHNSRAALSGLAHSAGYWRTWPVFKLLWRHHASWPCRGRHAAQNSSAFAIRTTAMTGSPPAAVAKRQDMATEIMPQVLLSSESGASAGKPPSEIASESLLAAPQNNRTAASSHQNNFSMLPWTAARNKKRMPRTACM